MKIISFTELENQVKFAVRKYNIHKGLSELGVNFEYLGPPSKFTLFKVSSASFRNIRKLLQIRRKNNNTWLHFDNSVSPFFLKTVKFLTGCQIFIDVRDNQNKQAEAYKIKLDEQTRVKRQKAMLQNVKASDLYTVTSHTQKLSYPSQLHNKITVIENASDPKHFTFTNYKGNFTIGTLTGLTEGRGIDMMLDAALLVKQHIPQLEVKIGFTRYEKDDFPDRLMKKYNFEWIEFREDISYSKNAPEFFSKLDLVVIPHPKNSYFDEILPVKMFDALSSGKPLVVTNCNEMATLTKKFGVGYVSDFNSINMSEKILNILNDDKIANDFSLKGRSLIEQQFNWFNLSKLLLLKLKEVGKNV